MTNEEIEVYTDGACRGNPGPGGIAVVLRYKNLVRVYTEHLPNTTNNIAELTAILRALQLVKRKDLPIVIYTDSQYAIGVLTGAYRVKKNRELIEEIRARLRSFAKVRLAKVKGHVGIPGNEQVDRLAKEAARGRVVNKTLVV